MNTSESFWIFGHTGLGDHICLNGLYRHYASLHKDKVVIIPIWEHNLAAVQWMLSDVPNIFFYPIETEQQLLTCRDTITNDRKLSLGFYACKYQEPQFNPLLWDSEFYRQAGLDPELKWQGFKLPDIVIESYDVPPARFVVCHQDRDRGFGFRKQNTPGDEFWLTKELTLKTSAKALTLATEIHCIESSMLNLADLMETPYCKRFVFHRYARKSIAPKLRKNWEIID